MHGIILRAYGVFSDRFMLTPRPTMEKDLKSQEKELTDDVNNLNKKVRSDHRNSSDALSIPGRLNISKKLSMKLKLS